MKRIFSSCRPIVKAGGSVQIKVGQSLAAPSPLIQEGPDFVHVLISGPQSSFLADMIAGVYPASGSEESPDEFLPHVALTRRTLPWERTGPNGNDDTPWMALLLFKESELRSPLELKQSPTTSVQTSKVQDITDLAARNRFINTLTIPPDTDVSTLTVNNAILSKVMPTETELTLLCHVKQSTVNGVNVDHAVVISNRLPDASALPGEKPELHTAVLISVELAPELFSLPPAGTTTLLVLHHWTFRPSQGGDFEQVMKSVAYRPHGGVLRFGNLPAIVGPGEQSSLSGGFKGIIDKDGYFLTRVEHDQDTNATYRSPLRPFGPQPRSPGFAISATPNEFQNAPSGTPLDYSDAAAFELGRLLALNDPAILEDLRHVRAKLRTIDPPVRVNPLPPVLQKPDWVVNPAWSKQPWDIIPGQSLVKDQNQLLVKGVGDITGIQAHLDQWDVGNVITELTNMGPAIAMPVSPLNIAAMNVDALEIQFAEVAQAAKA